MGLANGIGYDNNRFSLFARDEKATEVSLNYAGPGHAEFVALAMEDACSFARAFHLHLRTPNLRARGSILNYGHETVAYPCACMIDSISYITKLDVPLFTRGKYRRSRYGV